MAGSILDRPFGARVSPQHAASMQRTVDGLLDGTARPGDLLAAASDLEDGRIALAGPRGCKDCGQPRVKPLSSQPMRCRQCGSAKRKEQNRKYKEDTLAAAAREEAAAVPSTPDFG